MSIIETILRTSPVIPVLEVNTPLYAKQLAQAVVDGGLSTIEVAFRGNSFVPALSEMSSVFGAIVGVGGISTFDQIAAAVRGGASYVCADVLDERLVQQADALRIPILPTIESREDVRRGLAMGLTHFKFNSISASIDASFLDELAAESPVARFCVSGEHNRDGILKWLAHAHIACVCESWSVPSGPPKIVSIRAASNLAFQCGQNRKISKATRVQYLPSFDGRCRPRERRRVSAKLR